MTGERQIAIGDIHGCIHALDAILDAVDPQPSDRLVVLGDFVDQGYETRNVIERLIRLQEKCQLIHLMGNHEEMLLAALEGGEASRYWEQCGGVSTLNSYRFGGSTECIPTEHLDFIRSARDYFETSEHIFVHAGFDPTLPMKLQPAHLTRWSLLDPDDMICHESGKTVVVGHTEQRNGEVLDLDCVKCIDTACCRYGWLTAFDTISGRIWQASRFGVMREPHEQPVGQIRPNIKITESRR